MPSFCYQTDLFNLLTSLKMRFRGKNGFYFLSELKRFWKKAKLRPEKRFEANAL